MLRQDGNVRRWVDENAVGRENTENPRGLWRRTLQEDVSRHNQQVSGTYGRAIGARTATGARMAIGAELEVFTEFRVELGHQDISSHG